MMMRPETRLRIYQAADDWVHGLTVAEIAAKYDRSKWTVYQWKQTDAWAEAVAGRTRQKRKSPVRYNRFDDFSALELTAKRFVALAKPPKHVFAKEIGLSKKKLDTYMQSPFWEPTVLYAAHFAEREKKRKKRTRDAGRNFPFHLLKQAVFLDLAGWSSQEIAPVVGRNYRTVQGWQQMDAWFEMRETLLLDKLMMHMLHTGLTIQDLFRRFCQG